MVIVGGVDGSRSSKGCGCALTGLILAAVLLVLATGRFFGNSSLLELITQLLERQ
jgi:hypothetical protein